MAAETSDAQFTSEVLKSDVPVLVDFWAPWCGPCRALTPVIEELAKELAGKAKVYKLNIDNNPNTPAEYGVSGIPTVIIFKDGEEKDRFVGVQSKSTYLKALE